MPDISKHVPPNDAEAEAALIGALIIDPEAFREVGDVVRAEDFYQGRHRLQFEAIESLDASGSAVDAITLKDELTRRGNLDKAGGVDALIAAMESVTSAAAVKHHARIVRDLADRRALIRACHDTLADIADASRLTAEVVDAAEQRVYDIRRQFEGETVVVRDRLGEKIEEIESRKNRPETVGIPTGFADLDELLGGMRAGELIVLAARPSMGKSSLANNIATNVALRGGRDVISFSLEVPKGQVVENLLTAQSGIDSALIRRGELDGSQFVTLIEAGDAIAGGRDILVNDRAGITPQEMRAIARREASRRGRNVGVVMVDYLQLMRSPGAESRQHEITTISQSLKALARDLGVTVLALSQLNRAAEIRENHRPRLSDLRESGSLEQDADAVVLLYREGYYNQNAPPEVANVAEAIVAKNRNGPVGVAKLVFQKEALRFRDAARAWVAEI